MAKTLYPTRPGGWPADQPWVPDEVFGLVQAGLCLGKSVGFLPLKAYAPTEADLRRRPEWVGVRRVIEEWLLVEYACTWMPCNQEALIAGVSKATRKALGLEPTAPAGPGGWREGPPAGPHSTNPAEARASGAGVPFTPWPAVEKAVADALARADVAGIARRAAGEALDRHRGRV